MRLYKGTTFGEVYKSLLMDLQNSPEHVCAPRDQKINEVMNAAIEFDPRYSVYENPRRSSQMKYIAAELVWYFAGRNDIEFIERYAKFWRDIANPDGKTVNSAYGNLIFKKKNQHGLSQWEWAFESLKKDKDSRQAIMHFNMPEHQYPGNKDFVCTLNIVFHIRDNKLNMTNVMRSNDVILGLPTDVAFFCMLQQQMRFLLLKHYPDLELGTYTHLSSSMHLYERNFKLVKEMLDEKEFISLPFVLSPRGGFVDEHGNMTEEMELLHKFVDNNVKDDLVFNDPLFDWIYKNTLKEQPIIQK